MILYPLTTRLLPTNAHVVLLGSLVDSEQLWIQGQQHRQKAASSTELCTRRLQQPLLIPAQSQIEEKVMREHALEAAFAGTENPFLFISQ